MIYFTIFDILIKSNKNIYINLIFYLIFLLLILKRYKKVA